MRFLVADTLSGRVVGQLNQVNAFEITQPVRAAESGTITVGLPTDPAKIGHLVDITQPRIRWIAILDDQDRFLFGGPIPRRPAKNAGTITIPVVDWKSWFYRCPLRPQANNTRRVYNQAGREQTAIMTDLAALALSTSGAPRIVVDSPAGSPTSRDYTLQMLDTKIGDALDSITGLAGGCEWWTYITWDGDQTRLLPHFATAWPERAGRTQPVRLEYRQARGGNLADYTWPEGDDAATRVWALGSGEPPAQIFASDELPGLGAGTEVCWESVIGPVDGVDRTAKAFDAAFKEIQRSRGYDGTADLTVTAEKVPFGDVQPGDRARVVLDDGWVQADIPAARITQRVLRGGVGQALTQTLTVDLADDSYPYDGTAPGRPA